MRARRTSPPKEPRKGALNHPQSRKAPPNPKEKEWLAQVQQEANSEAPGFRRLRLYVRTALSWLTCLTAAQFLRLQQQEKAEARVVGRPPSQRC